VIVRFKKLRKHALVPEYATEYAAGADLKACLDQPVIIKPGDQSGIPIGIAIEIPAGYEAQIRPRSGLAAKDGITVLNAPGTIDSDYRGEVKVLLVNLGKKPVIIHHGDRIAQMVVAPVQKGEFIEQESLSETKRGTGGFGSTGL